MSSTDCDREETLASAVAAAMAAREPVLIRGGDTKHFYGETGSGRAIDQLRPSNPIRAGG